MPISAHLLCFFFLICSSVQGQQLSSEAPWTLLSTGNTLEGWSKMGGDAPYRIQDGVITGTTAEDTPNTFLTTDQHYGDFILELEYKVDPKMNSGVQIRSNSDPDYLDGRVHGYQIEIDPSPRAYSGGIFEEAGRKWLVKLDDNPTAQQAFRQNDWNHYRVEAIGDTIRTWINEIPAAHLIDGKTAEGFIGLQVHSIYGKMTPGMEISWRKVRVLTENLDKYARQSPLSPTVIAPASAPNIIFILTDDQRYDAIGYAGNDLLTTPEMDELARTGTYFNHAIVTTPICAASRASILTGLRERTHRFDFTSGHVAEEYMQNAYPRLLQQAGYQTAFYGKFGIKYDHPDSLFDVYQTYDRLDNYPDQRGYYYQTIGNDTVHLTRYTGQQAVDYIEGVDTKKPFCLSLSFSAPHAHDPAPEQYFWMTESDSLLAQTHVPQARLGSDENFGSQPENVRAGFNRLRWTWRYDTPEKYQHSVKGYYRMISDIDREIGKVRAELERKGLADNTVIIVMGDNGYFLGERQLAGKWLMYDNSIRVPLIIYDPREPVHRDIDQMVLNIDVPATILDLAGAKIPETYQGRGLKSVVNFGTELQRDTVLIEHLWEFAPIPPSEGVRTDEWKYFRYVNDKSLEELYFLSADPEEKVNLANDPEHRATLLALRQKCDALIIENSDDHSAPPTELGQVDEGTLSPTYRWQIPEAEGKQSAYQLLVSSSGEKSEQHIGDVWDSGKVTSTETNSTHRSELLKSGTTYFWSVRSWDEGNRPGRYSATHSFSTGAGQPLKLDNPITPEYLKKNLGGELPRLLLTPEVDKQLRDKIRSDSMVGQYYANMQAEARAILQLPVITREMEGFRLLFTAREVVRRMSVLTLVYRIDKDPAILQRIDAELKAVCSWEDWNPGHFLDIAEISLAFAMALDWTGEYLPKATVKLAKQALIEKAIEPSYDMSNERMGWINGTNNWNTVCHGGMVLAALTVADVAPDLAAKTISRALDKLPGSLAAYGPDGAYPEGPSYWDFGTAFGVLAADALRTALGTDFGITESPGFMESADFRLLATSPSGEFFNFADSGQFEGADGAFLLNYYAMRTGDPQYILQNQLVRADDTEFRMVGPALVWLAQFKEGNNKELPREWLGRGDNPVALFRDAPDDPNGFFLGAKGGRGQLSHGNLDAGSFIFDLDGVRWAVDPGNQRYFLLNKIGFELGKYCQDCERWSLLTKSNLTHSTLSVNNKRFIVTGYAPITNFHGGEQPTVAIDLTKLYGGDIASAHRTITREGKRSVLIEDRFIVNDSTESLTWALMTDAAVELTPEGAVLHKDGKSLQVDLLLPSRFQFSVVSLDPPPLEIDKRMPGLKRLEIRVPAYSVGAGPGVIRVRLSGKPITVTK